MRIAPPGSAKTLEIDVIRGGTRGAPRGGRGRGNGIDEESASTTSEGTHFLSSPDDTLDEVVDLEGGTSLGGPVLYVVLEADRPLARGARYSLAGVESITIGRTPGGEGAQRGIVRSDDGKQVHVYVPSPTMSSRHVRICALGGTWFAEDLRSRNGTYVDGEAVASIALRDGSLLEAGRVFFILRGPPTPSGNHPPQFVDEDDPSSTQPFGMRSLLPSLEEDHAALARVARGSSVPILLLGETGSGKEVIAREVHAQSGRSGPFVAVNCGALPMTLAESLLFGHVKGAFSGALRDELGFVRAADGGTLFLDEIGDLPVSSQPVLLRVLQEQEVLPLGATRGTRVDIRVVAATHQPLEARCRTDHFRSDLLARLRGYTHRLPPLRERREDFGVVFADILERVAGARAGTLTVSREAARALLAYDWPLNIRELEQGMASAAALADRVIEPRHLPAEVVAPKESTAGPPNNDELRERLISLLYGHRGNVTAVSRALGKAPEQIHRWMRRYDLDADMYRELRRLRHTGTDPARPITRVGESVTFADTQRRT
jgi:transcriptional regulator with AAA-type ATPase domain